MPKPTNSLALKGTAACDGATAWQVRNCTSPTPRFYGDPTAQRLLEDVEHMLYCQLSLYFRIFQDHRFLMILAPFAFLCPADISVLLITADLDEAMATDNGGG